MPVLRLTVTACLSGRLEGIPRQWLYKASDVWWEREAHCREQGLYEVRARGGDVSRTAGSSIPRLSRRRSDRWSPQHEPREFQRADESYRASQLHREVQADRNEERLLHSL